MQMRSQAHTLKVLVDADAVEVQLHVLFCSVDLKIEQNLVILVCKNCLTRK